MKYYSVTKDDLNFYKMYERWYYCLSTYYKAEQDLDVGDVVKYNDRLAVVSGLSGLHRNLYIIRWDDRSNRYWRYRVRQSELVIDSQDYINVKEYKDLYAAYIDWFSKNNFTICTEHFRYNWNEYKSGKITEIESAYLVWKLSKENNNLILGHIKNFVPRIVKKKEVIL